MSETVDSWLGDLNSLYTPLASDFDGAKSHKDAIEAKLDWSIGVYRMFEIGSLRHGTGVWQYSDADFLVSLKGDKPGSSTTTLERVKTALQARFPSTTITIRRPAVVCNFADGIVEVVPGYIGDGYSIADPANVGSWMKSHPEDHNKYVNEVNREFGGAAKKLARQLKVWKYKRHVPISSCYLEMRAAKYMDAEKSYVPVLDLHRMLRHLQVIGLASMNDPTGLSSRFNACSSTATRTDALSKLDTAVARAEKAKDHWVAGDHDKAIAQLKLLFNR
ncbi:SMODS domain-containing nucleotidyltransferase [Tessaracoccus sp. Y1736]